MEIANQLNMSQASSISLDFKLSSWLNIPTVNQAWQQHFKTNIKGNIMPIRKKLEHLQLSYDPHLTETLHEEHKNLMSHMQFMQKSVEKNELPLLPIALELFRGEMLEHVSKEILQLYVYLRNALKDQPEQYELMKTLRKEMDHLLDVMLNFLDEYSDIEIDALMTDPKIQTNFSEGINKLVTLFNQRIDVEESILFPLYKQVQ